MTPVDAPVPIVLLTGFLGTGKTTLLQHLLADPACRDVAVMINELGEVGLDGPLVLGPGGTDAAGEPGAADVSEAADARARLATLLSGGCVCCTVNDALEQALEALIERREASGAAPFSRVIIETTGIAHPVPILASIGLAAAASGRCLLERVICTVDAAAGVGQIDRHPECLAQIVVADDLLITRVDLADSASIETLDARLAELNPRARRFRVVAGAITPATLFDAAPRAAGDATESDARPLDAAPRASAGLLRSGQRLRPVASAHAGVQADTLRFAGRTVWSVALEGIERVAAAKGDALLRIKGVLRLDGYAEPMVVQWAGGRISPLVPLPGALAPDDAGYLVIISEAGSG